MVHMQIFCRKRDNKYMTERFLILSFQKQIILFGQLVWKDSESRLMQVFWELEYLLRILK